LFNRSVYENFFIKYPKLKEAFLVAIAFSVLELILISFHEVWRDELQSWSLSLSSNSFSELFFNSRYEGHPKLWYIILYCVQHFTHDIFFMQLLHLVIAASTVFVFCFYSPLGLLKNVLFCFGYFFAYEYSIISRNYAVEMLLLFLCAGIYLKKGDKAILQISVLIFFILQTNVFAVIIGSVFLGYILLNMKKTELFNIKLFIAGIIILTGLIVFLKTTIPPSDGGFVRTWNIVPSTSHALRVGSNLFRAYIPIPQLIPQFWETNVFDSINNYIIPECLLSLMILIICSIIFYKYWNILFLFYAGTFSILIFTYTKYIGYTRHHGHFFVLFILCYWLYFDKKKKNSSTRIPGNNRLPDLFLKLILTFQIAAFLIAGWYDIKYPFSNAEAASKFIKDYSYDKMIIAGDIDAPVSTIACLMNKNFYYLNGRRWGTALLWDTIRKEIFDTTNFHLTINLADYFKSDFLLILSYNPGNSPPNFYLLKSFDKAIVNDENYFVYLVKYIKPIKK
jgi:hypothetical protein